MDNSRGRQLKSVSTKKTKLNIDVKVLSKNLLDAIVLINVEVMGIFYQDGDGDSDEKESLSLSLSLFWCDLFARHNRELVWFCANGNTRTLTTFVSETQKMFQKSSPRRRRSSLCSTSNGYPTE